MKLIEKKCPNCGANLEFNDTDKSCKCEYCKRSFEIERNETADKEKNLADQFNLNELKTPLKIFGAYMAGTYIVSAIIIIISIIIFGFIFFGIFSTIHNHSNPNSSYSDHTSDENDDFIDNFLEKIQSSQKENKYIQTVDDLTNDDYEELDNDATLAIPYVAQGRSDASHSYSMYGDIKKEKIIVAALEDKNCIVAIYKGQYHDFFHQENTYTVYFPIVYENIKVNDYGNKFKNPEIKAPEYYFNDDHSSYVYGYSSYDEAYNALINPLKEQNYKITEK